jgi:glycosyltransferase involved in cell wall biosynthesis
MKVLHLITWLVHGGIEQWLLQMARTIPRSQCAMDFCCKGANLGWRADEAYEVHSEVLHCPLRPTVVGFVRQLKEILAAGRYDLLHVHLDAHSGLPVYVARSIGLPVVVTFHNTYFAPGVWWTKFAGVRHLRALYSKYSVRYAVDHATLVTGVSQGVLQSVYGRQTPDPQRSRVLYLGTPTPRPLTSEQKQALRQAIGIPPAAPLLLHVASFSPAKNHAGLLDIFARVAQRVPGVHLAMTGDGALRGEIEQRVRHQPYRDSVHFLGLRNDVTDLMQASDAFVFPSFHEGFGIVLIEAQAAALPIVASRIGGVTEAVEDSVTAILHDPADIDGMAASTVRLLTDADRRRSLVDAGMARHRALFTQEAAVKRLLELYADCLATAGKESS